MPLIPILNFAEVKVTWLCLQTNNVNLFGFLLYTNSDRVMIDYMSDGICELDVLSGNNCLVFVIESPSEGWIEYTRSNNHLWWQNFGQNPNAESVPASSANSRERTMSLLKQTILRNNSDCNIIVGDNNKVSIRQITNPDINLPFNRTEALLIARNFNLQYNDIPCLIFFRDLNSSTIWKCPLGNLTTQPDVTNFFRGFFGGTDFQSLLTYTDLIARHSDGID